MDACSVPERSPGGRAAFVVLTCEHGGNQVPDEHRALFAGAKHALESHRGYDPGSLGVATQMAARISAPLVVCLTTRLLVEPNRSIDHPDLFSVYSRTLPEPAKRDLVAEHYLPHRTSVERIIVAAVATGHHVLHIGVHSFTDVLDGVKRNVDLGVLFDPARPPEGDRAAAWMAALSRVRPDLRVRANEPYRGTDDGLTTTLRRRFPSESYTGLEIEARQGLIGPPDEQFAVGTLLAETLQEAMRE